MSKTFVDKVKAKLGAVPRTTLPALWPEIEEALNEGGTIRAVFEVLKEDGRYSGSFETLARFVRKKRKVQEAPQQTRPGAATAPRPADGLSPKPVDKKKAMPPFQYSAEAKFDPEDLSDSPTEPE